MARPAPYLRKQLIIAVLFAGILIPLKVVGQSNGQKTTIGDTLVFYASRYKTASVVLSEYPGGKPAAIHFLQTHMGPAAKLKVSDNSPGDEVAATISINFEIGKDGKIIDVRFSGDVDHQTEVELVRVLKLMKWNPATDKGIPVSDGKSMEITFAKKP